MNVKNGIASSVELLMIPSTRSGSACSSAGSSVAVRDADERRTAARWRRARTRPGSRAAGTPRAPPNMNGAIRSNDIRRAPSSRTRKRGCSRSRNATRLIDFRDALQREQRERDGDQQPHRPADQPARIRRVLADVVRVEQRRPAVPGDDDDGRQQHEQRAEDVDPRLAARRQAAVEDVDAHVLVELERIRRDQQEDSGVEIPLQSRATRSSRC